VEPECVIADEFMAAMFATVDSDNQRGVKHVV
jgi:hypothetical protein